MTLLLLQRQHGCKGVVLHNNSVVTNLVSSKSWNFGHTHWFVYLFVCLFVCLFIFVCFEFSLSLAVCQCAKCINLMYLLHLFRITTWVTTNVTAEMSEPFNWWSSLKGTATLMISMFYQKELNEP